MKKIFSLIFLLMLGLGLNSCTTRVMDYTILSTRNVDLTGSKYLVQSPDLVKGYDTVAYILIIPTGRLSIKDAIDDAINKVPGCVALANVKIYQTAVPLILVNTVSYVVEGNPIIDKRILNAFQKVGKKDIPSKYIYSYYDEKKKDFVVKYLSKEEYTQLKKQLK